jgi:hypothetical protein
MQRYTEHTLVPPSSRTGTCIDYLPYKCGVPMLPELRRSGLPSRCHPAPSNAPTRPSNRPSSCYRGTNDCPHIIGLRVAQSRKERERPISVSMHSAACSAALVAIA